MSKISKRRGHLKPLIRYFKHRFYVKCPKCPKYPNIFFRIGLAYIRSILNINY